MAAESPEELGEWLNVLKSVQGKTKDQLQTMLDNARVNPRNAEVHLH
jgi:hypothetical protein